MTEDQADEHYSEYGRLTVQQVWSAERPSEPDPNPCPDGCMGCDICRGAKW